MSGDDADIVKKIKNYRDQLEQVEAALAINPSHDDLLSIKANLQEILQILKSKMPSLDTTHDTVVSSREPENYEKVENATENIEKDNVVKELNPYDGLCNHDLVDDGTLLRDFSLILEAEISTTVRNRLRRRMNKLCHQQINVERVSTGLEPLHIESELENPVLLSREDASRVRAFPVSAGEGRRIRVHDNVHRILFALVPSKHAVNKGCTKIG